MAVDWLLRSLESRHEVFLYPENILLPSLRRQKTPAFRELVEALRTNPRLTPQGARDLAKHYETYFNDVCSLKVQATCTAETRIKRHQKDKRPLFYMFGLGGLTGRVYWSAYDPALENADYAQTLWDEVPGLENVTQVIGAVPYEVAEGTSFIYLFALTQVKGATQLGFIKYDLENPKSQRWDSEPTILEDIPESATQFTAVVKQYNRVGDQTNKTKTQPHLAIRLPNGRIYDRYLNQEGSEWAEGEWKPLVGHAIGSTFHQLCGMVEISEKDFCLIASKAPTSCKLFYHIFGELDDGLWRSLPTKQNNPNNICIYEGAFAFHPDYAAPCALPLRIFGGTR